MSDYSLGAKFSLFCSEGQREAYTTLKTPYFKDLNGT